MDESLENTLKIGTILANGDRKYRIVEVLGKGGFGITYLAIGEVMVGNVTTEAKFAIKEHFPAVYCDRSGNTVSPKHDKVEEFAKSKSDFSSEARKLHALGVENKNIVKVNEVFEENGTAYYVMQYINGESLTSYVKSHGKLSYNTAIKLLTPIVNAAEFLHKSRINHLDIKPDNIMLHDALDGISPVLIDFGLSIHFKKNGDKTSPKSVMGVSEGFSPLEQYAGIKEFIPQADIYALAATLLFMLTGETPKSASELKISEVRSLLNGRLPENVVSAICKALNKSYEDRTATIGIFKSDLGISSAGDGTDTIVIDSEEDDKKRKKMILIFSIIGIILLCVIIGLLSHGNKTGSKNKDDAVVTDSITNNQEGKVDSVVLTTAVDSTSVSSLQGTITSTEHGQNQTSTAFNQENTSMTAGNMPPKSEPPKIESNGTLSLGYGTWTGGIKNGKPDGNGRMTFHSSHRVSSTLEAAPGSHIIGDYERGKLVSGKYYDSEGNFIKTVIP